MNVVDKLIDLRKKLGVKQADLAQRVGWNQQYVSFIETTKYDSLEKLELYAEGLGKFLVVYIVDDVDVDPNGLASHWEEQAEVWKAEYQASEDERATLAQEAATFQHRLSHALTVLTARGPKTPLEREVFGILSGTHPQKE